MGTGACLLDKESDMPCGLIIEKVNGIPCEKRLASDDKTFADVRYLLEMCRQVRHIHMYLKFQYMATAGILMLPCIVVMYHWHMHKPRLQFIAAPGKFKTCIVECSHKGQLE